MVAVVICTGLGGDQVLEDDLGEGDVDRLTVEAGERRDPDEGALELADVRGDLRRDELQHLVRGSREALLDGLLAQDRDAGLKVGWLDVGDQAPLEPGSHAGPRSPGSCLGGRSEVMTICLLALCSVLKVWKNSSCVCTLP
jgi:hypothetical protein